MTSPAAAGSGGSPAAARTMDNAYNIPSSSARVGDKEWVRLKDRLLKEVDAAKDSLRFYFLDKAAAERVEHHGIREPRDLSEPLVI